MELEINGKRKKGQPRKFREECKEGSGTIRLEKRGYVQSTEIARAN